MAWSKKLMLKSIHPNLNELFVNDFVAYGGNKYSKNIIANKKKRG